MAEPDAAVYQDDGGGWSWRIKAANGEIVAVGESYTRREDAQRGLNTALETAANVLLGEDGD